MAMNETVRLNKSSNRFEMTHLFGFSYLWYSLIAVFNVFFVGILISFLTGFTQTKTLDKKLYINIFKVMCKRNKKVKILKIIYPKTLFFTQNS